MLCCRLHKNFKEFEQIKPGFAIEEIYGGALLGLRSQDFVCFYDWTTAQVCFSAITPAISMYAVKTTPLYLVSLRRACMADSASLKIAGSRICKVEAAFTGGYCGTVCACAAGQAHCASQGPLSRASVVDVDKEPPFPAALVSRFEILL